MSLMMVQRTKILMWPTSLLKAITTFNLKMHLSECSVTGVSQVSCQESVSVCVCVCVCVCVSVCVLSVLPREFGFWPIIAFIIYLNLDVFTSR